MSPSQVSTAGGSWRERERESTWAERNAQNRTPLGTSYSFIVVLGLREESVELRLHAHPLYIVLRHVRVRPVAARGAFA